jgi:hypothetical protein
MLPRGPMRTLGGWRSHPHISVFLASWLFVATGCGGVATSADGETGDSGRTMSHGDGGKNVDCGKMSSGEADSGAPYTGIVLATVTQTETKNTYGVFADFTQGTPRATGGASQSCVCQEGIVLPVMPPDAGTLTIESASGAVLTTLTPANENSASGSYSGTWDLGANAWAYSPGNYDTVVSPAWTPGEALEVCATGDQVPAFSGSLHTGALLSGITPSIGAASVTVQRSQGFKVSWAPGPRSDDTVLLTLQQITSSTIATCTCTAPDSAGSVSIDSKRLLSQYVATKQLSGTIWLARTTVTTVSSGNASIELIGEVMVTGPATFE